MKMNKLSIVFAAIGIIILVLAIVLGFVVFPKTVDNKIKAELKLVRGTPVWNKWSDIESPIFISFYIFHVANPDAVEQGQKPTLVERGPYVYRQRRTKIDPHSESCKETVKYEQKVTYWFDQEKSGTRKETDLVNVVNVPFISVMTGLQRLGLDPVIISMVSGTILAAEHIIRRNVMVGELLFLGFDVSNYNNPVIAPYLPEEFTGFRFGLYRGRNGTTDGLYEIYTGAKEGDSKRFGEIKTWNGKEALPYWKDPECDQLSGTDGTIFRPFLEEGDSVTIFNTDLCRLLRLSYKEEVTVKDVKGYRFTPPKDVLQGGANNGANQCYCKRPNVTECQDGVIDVSVCRNGAPILLSTPYWLDGYVGYQDDVGLVGKADRDKHETRIDIEPRTGLLLEAHKKIQVNVEVKKIEGSPQLGNVAKPFLFPAMWLDEEAIICDVDVDDMKNRIDKPIKIVNIVRWVAIGVGAFFVLLALAAPFICKGKSRKTV